MFESFEFSDPSAHRRLLPATHAHSAALPLLLPSFYRPVPRCCAPSLSSVPSRSSLHKVSALDVACCVPDWLVGGVEGSGVRTCTRDRCRRACAPGRDSKLEQFRGRSRESGRSRQRGRGIDRDEKLSKQRERKRARGQGSVRSAGLLGSHLHCLQPDPQRAR